MRAPEPTFIADAMLGRLARSLRMLGYDVSYRPHIDDVELKREAVRERRVILTRDNEVAATRLPVRVVLIESDDHGEQLKQVVRQLELSVRGARFTRCLVCNVPVESVPKEEVEGDVPPYVYATQERFARCPRCGRIYWAATHVANAERWLDELLGAGGSTGGGGRGAEGSDGEPD